MVEMTADELLKVTNVIQTVSDIYARFRKHCFVNAISVMCSLRKNGRNRKFQVGLSSIKSESFVAFSSLTNIWGKMEFRTKFGRQKPSVQKTPRE